MFSPLRKLVPNRRPEVPSNRGLTRWVSRRLAQLSYAVLVEPTWLEVNRLQIPLTGSNGSRGLRVVQLTDFHFQKRVPASYVESCVRAANAEQPDVIALTGDYVHKGARYVEGISDLLAGLKAPLGVFAVLGNHDHAVRNSLGVRRYPKLHQKVAESLQRRGIRVLHNELLTIDHPGMRFQISGVDDLWSRRCRPDLVLSAVDPALPHVMLAHHPRTIELLGASRCDLMLSGHTHGGQVHSQRYGSITLSKRMRGYAAGLYTVGASRLYVNKGVGFGLRIRYNRRPEIAVFDLVPGSTVVTPHVTPPEPSSASAGG